MVGENTHLSGLGGDVDLDTKCGRRIVSNEREQMTVRQGPPSWCREIEDRKHVHAGRLENGLKRRLLVSH